MKTETDKGMKTVKKDKPAPRELEETTVIDMDNPFVQINYHEAEARRSLWGTVFNREVKDK